MKKLLLGLGTSLLAVIPLAAVVSCSSSVTPTLETEAAKFETSKTKTPTTTSGDAAKSINDATSAAGKLTALNVFATVPTLSSGFTFEVKSAKINSTTNTSVDVKITVTETATSKTKDVTFVVTGLTITPPSLETEEAKFGTVVTKAQSTTSMAAAKSLNDAANDEAKFEALKVLAEVPTLETGFTFTVMGGAIDKITETTLNVRITIVKEGETTEPNTKVITFVVTGLTAPTAQEITALKALINTEAEKLVTKVSKVTNETATVAKATITNNETLKAYYAEVSLATGFVYEFVSSEIDATIATTLNVTVKVSNELYGSSSVDQVIKITGFSS